MIRFLDNSYPKHRDNRDFLIPKLCQYTNNPFSRENCLKNNDKARNAKPQKLPKMIRFRQTKKKLIIKIIISTSCFFG